MLGQQGGGQNTHFLPGIGQQEAGAWMYYHTDALGSIRHMTANNGNSLGEMRYSPFGERVESTGVLPFMGFTGEPMSPTTDLTYLRARYYNPSLGRFLTQDTIVPDPMNGQAWNRYAYVYNDPMNLVDPSGHNPVLGGLIFGAGIDLFMQGAANDWKWECINWAQVGISGVVGMYGGAVGVPISGFSSPKVRFALNAGLSGLIGGIGSAVNNHLAGNDPMQGIGRVVVLSALFGGLSSRLDDITTPIAGKIKVPSFYEGGGSTSGGVTHIYGKLNKSHLIKAPVKGLLKGAPFPLANSGPFLDAVVPDFMNDFLNQSDLWEPPDNRPSGCEC